MTPLIIPMSRGSSLRFQLNWPSQLGSTFSIFEPHEALGDFITVQVLDVLIPRIEVFILWSNTFVDGAKMSFRIRAVNGANSKTIHLRLDVS